MTTDPSKDARNGITLTSLFIAAAIAAVVGVVVLAILLGFDLEDSQPTPNRPTLAAITVTAMLLVGLFCVALRDSFTRRVEQVSAEKDLRLDSIHDSLVEISTAIGDFRRQSGNAMVVIHDELNRLGEGHTEELVRLTETIQEWGEAQETKGELTGLRRAVGTASVDGSRPGKLVELRPTS